MKENNNKEMQENDLVIMNEEKGRTRAQITEDDNYTSSEREESLGFGCTVQGKKIEGENGNITAKGSVHKHRLVPKSI